MLNTIADWDWGLIDVIEIFAFLRGKAEEVDKFFEGKSANIEKQTLKEHIDKALKALDEVKNSKIWKYAVKLFEGDEHLVEEYLKIIILLHDIGKIFYQANIFLDKKKGVKYLNFKGHEYFSTYLADEYLLLENNNIISSSCNGFKGKGVTHPLITMQYLDIITFNSNIIRQFEDKPIFEDSNEENRERAWRLA